MLPVCYILINIMRFDSSKEQVIQDLEILRRIMKKGPGEREVRISYVLFLLRTEIFNMERAY